WLKNWNSAACQRCLDRRGLKELGAPGRFVRLCNDPGKLVFLRLQQPTQNRQADFAGPDEDNAHRALELDPLPGSPPTGTTGDGSLGHQFFTRGNFALTNRQSAAGAEIIVNFL